MSDYAPKVFTRDNPCTKIDLHNCFYRHGQYIDRPVIEAKTEVGENAPKYLLRENYMTTYSRGGVDYYHLTASGEEWLRRGTLRFLALHPERADECHELPAGHVSGAGKRKAAKPSKTVPTAARFVRRTPHLPQAEAPKRIVRRTPKSV